MPTETPTSTPSTTPTATPALPADTVTLSRSEYDRLAGLTSKLATLEAQMAELKTDSENAAKAFHPKTDEAAREVALAYWLKKSGLSDEEVKARLAEDSDDTPPTPNKAKPGTGGASPDIENLVAARMKPVQDELLALRREEAERRLNEAMEGEFANGSLKPLLEQMQKIDPEAVSDFKNSLTAQLRQHSLTELDKQYRNVGRFDASMIAPSVKAAAGHVAKPLRSLGKAANSIGKSQEISSVEEFFQQQKKVEPPKGLIRNAADAEQLTNWAAQSLIETLRPSGTSDGSA